jgi:hypothetical protein
VVAKSAGKTAAKALFNAGAKAVNVTGKGAKVTGAYARKAAVAFTRQAAVAAKAGKNVLAHAGRAIRNFVCWVTDNCFIPGSGLTLEEEMEAWLAALDDADEVMIADCSRLYSTLFVGALAAAAGIELERRRRRKSIDDIFQQWDEVDPSTNFTPPAKQFRSTAAAADVWDAALSDESLDLEGADFDDELDECFLLFSHNR